jgi:proteasome lid subunit RPN8/RPN11
MTKHMVGIPQARVDEIIAHALETPDAEICGILAGEGDRVARAYRAGNIAETPRTRFKMDPHDILAITEEIDSAGLDLVGFYHSHTHTQAYPSPTDVADWPARWYPDAYCFICSLMEEDRPHLRAFRIDEDGTITEVTLTIEE